MNPPIAICVLLFGMAAMPGRAQYYPGQYPGGYSGRGRIGEMGTPRGPNSPLVDFHGTVKSATSKKLTIEVDSSNMVDFHLSKKTTFYRGEKPVKAFPLESGAVVSIEAKRAGDNSMDAVTVKLESPKS